MSTKNVFVFCGDDCKSEGMTKEQILAAIEQAITTGEIKDIDTGFVTKIKEQNSGAGLKFWVGTSAEFNAIETKENNCFYILTDDTTGDDIEAAITTLTKEIEDMKTEKNKVLWEGTAEVNETTARAEITVPDISKYKMLNIDGNIYTLQGDGAFYNSVEGTRRNTADGKLWFVIDVRCLWIDESATDKVFLAYADDQKVSSLTRTMFNINDNTTQVAFMNSFTINKIIGII